MCKFVDKKVILAKKGEMPATMSTKNKRNKNKSFSRLTGSISLDSHFPANKNDSTH